MAGFKKNAKKLFTSRKGHKYDTEVFFMPCLASADIFSRVFFFYKTPYPIGTKVFLVMSRKAILVLFSADIKVIAEIIAFWFFQLCKEK